MRWFPFSILAYLVLGLQVGLGDLMSWGGGRPNFVLVAALFLALNAPREPALLGCFFLGLLQDCFSQHPLGLYALAYGLVGMLIVGLQQSVNRSHLLVRGVLALVAGLLVAVVVWLNLALRPPAPPLLDAPGPAPAIRGSIAALFLGALYTSMLAPPLLWLLDRIKRRFAFQSGARRGRR